MNSIKTIKTKEHSRTNFCTTLVHSFMHGEENDKRLSLGEYWLFYLIPIFLWMFIIYLLSSQSTLTSGGSTFDLTAYLLRKTAHIGEYFVLTILIVRAIDILDQPINRALLMGGAFSLLYALSDELHQTFVPLRDGKFMDIGIDLIGIIIALLVYALWYNSVEGKK